MRNICFALITILLVASTAFAAEDQKKKEDRLENAGQVMGEILNMPDSIPHDLLDKAKCVVVIPSVLKAEVMDAERWFAAAVRISPGPGARRPCSRWKAEVLVFSWALRPLILCF